MYVCAHKNILIYILFKLKSLYMHKYILFIFKHLKNNVEKYKSIQRQL